MRWLEPGAVKLESVEGLRRRSAVPVYPAPAVEAYPDGGGRALAATIPPADRQLDLPVRRCWPLDPGGSERAAGTPTPPQDAAGSHLLFLLPTQATRSFMTAVLTLLIVVTLALIVTRIASSALVLTGLSMDVARFQARSAFTGCGFATQEAESIMSHPARRRIIMLLMLWGNAGLVTSVASLLFTFADVSSSAAAWWRAGALMAGLLVLWLLARSEWLDRHMSRLFQKLLRRWSTLEVHDYISLLDLAGHFSVAEMQVQEGHWLADRQLRELRLPDEGVTVLGIQRSDGDYVGVPSADEQLFAKDVVVLYGQKDAIQSIDRRTRDEAGLANRAESVERECRRKQKQTAMERMREEEIRDTAGRKGESGARRREQGMGRGA